MKVCKKAFEHMYIIGTEVWPCCWLNKKGSEWCMGNILTQSVEDIFNSDKALEFRESILDGSYRYCSRQDCSDLSNDWLPDLSVEEIEEIKKNRVPRTFILAYEETCNHACISCRHEYFRGSEDYYKNVDLIGEKLLDYLNNAVYIDANGRGEIMVSEHMLQTLDKVEPKRKDFSFYIETNAALFDEKHFKRIEHLTKHNFEVMATVNSFNDATYRYLNGYANHVEQVIDNLRYMKALRESNVINKLTLSIIVQENNFRELPDYVKRCLTEFGADAVRIRGIMKFNMDEDDFWLKDVFNPGHPFYREALDILHHPNLQDERVWFWEGDYEKSRTPNKDPEKRFRTNYENLWELIKADNDGILGNNLKALNGKSIALYGAGHIAEFLISKFKENGYSGELFLMDSFHGGKMGGLPIYDLGKPDAVIPKCELIINTITYYKEEVHDITQKYGYKGNYMELCDLIQGECC